MLYEKLIWKIKEYIYCVFILCCVVFYSFFDKKKQLVFCECYMCHSIKPFKHHNWGDDLNKYFFEFASDVKIFNAPFSKIKSLINITSYSLIGSIITFYNLDNKIIYGSGIKSPLSRIYGIPKKIVSVRGPKTREVLIKKGIDCPEKYGDPALLLPIFYNPKPQKTGKGGLILNIGTEDKDKTLINQIVKKYDLNIISMINYSNWTDVIDQICACDYIISESLHGLIVSETYGIPNVWVEFISHPDYWNFKFEDFFESIGKKEKIIKIQNENLKEIEQKIGNWKKGEINYSQMLDLFPFKIKKDFDIQLYKINN